MYGILAFIFFVVAMFGNVDCFYISALFAIADAIIALRETIKDEK